MIKNFLSSIVVSLFLILLVILCSENDKEESRHEPQNTWFYMPTQKEVEYEGYFYPYSYRDIWQDISLHIKELKSFQNGSLYALELDQLNVTDPFDQFALGREYLGYYYVTSEDIYYMPSDTGGYTEEKNEIIISGLESDEDLFLKEWTIVCCENGTADVVDDAGYHAFVEADGEKRIFRYYNDYFYGSKDYLLMVWEKGIGIVYYMHGNGQKNMHVEFGTDLKKQQKEDYGYPYKLFH